MANAPVSSGGKSPTTNPPKASGQFHNIVGRPGQFLSGSAEIDNLAELADYLIGHGFSKEAAVGVAATVAGESTGNPELSGSGGTGLIGWTPPSTMARYGGTETGNPTHDMETQAAALIRYAQANQGAARARGGVDLKTLMRATSSQQAASWWSAFEGPLKPGSDIRLGLIGAISAKVGAPIGGGVQGTGTPGATTLVFGGAPTQFATTKSHSSASETSFWGDIWGGVEAVGGAITDPLSGLVGMFHSVSGFTSDIAVFVKMISWLFKPSSWLRILSGVAGFVFAVVAAVMLYKAAGGDTPKMPPIIPVPI